MPDDTTFERFEITDANHGRLPALALFPARAGENLPVCLFLYGGGGTVDTLLMLEQVLGPAWRNQDLAPMLVASVAVPPFCFYLDDPKRGMYWQSAVAQGLLQGLRRHFGSRASASRAGLVGISMGGYGALKIAFSEPRTFACVAAVAPMVEPSDRTEAVPLRNRFHYPDLVPSALLGKDRDAELFSADHPATRARLNSAEIRAAELAISIDAGSRDALNAHDGAEALHRVLWQLDIRHEYHLLRDADHVGPSIVPRLLQAFRWVGVHSQPKAERPPSADEQALRDHVAPLRAAASTLDPLLPRTYGVL